MAQHVPELGNPQDQCCIYERCEIILIDMEKCIWMKVSYICGRPISQAVFNGIMK